jgi:hypothetical protein
MPIFSMTRIDGRLLALVNETTSARPSGPKASFRTALAPSGAKPKPQ